MRSRDGGGGDGGQGGNRVRGMWGGVLSCHRDVVVVVVVVGGVLTLVLARHSDRRGARDHQATTMRAARIHGRPSLNYFSRSPFGMEKHSSNLLVRAPSNSSIYIMTSGLK